MFTTTKTRVALVGYSLALILGGCSPPPEETLSECRTVAVQRGIGKNLSPDDLGELTEACMTSKGFTLNRDSDYCGHNRSSETARRCYYPNTAAGILTHQLSHLFPE